MDTYHSAPSSSAPHQVHYTSSSSSRAPQTFPSNIDAHSSPIYPYPSLTRLPPRRPQHSFSSPIPLQVTTSLQSDHDPNESTARPGNAHKHAQFHMSIAAHNNESGPETPHVKTSESDGEEALHDHDERIHPRQIHAQDDVLLAASDAPQGLSRPLTAQEEDKLAYLDRLKFFLATAPSHWDSTDPSSSTTNLYGNSSSFTGSSVDMMSHRSVALGHAPPHPQLNRFLLPSQEFVTCVLWNRLYHITGTDIVRALVFRFDAFGRPVRNMKKFEEGVFSDLRNLKPGIDACLEEPKSPFLDLLFKYQCIRTQKKQKVFFWFSVPHDRLFLDALERDLKREKMGLESTTEVIGEPALSFTYDPKRSLYEQFSRAARENDGDLDDALRQSAEGAESNIDGDASSVPAQIDASEESSSAAAQSTGTNDKNDVNMNGESATAEAEDAEKKQASGVAPLQKKATNSNRYFGAQYLMLFEMNQGSPNYKIRRKKAGVKGSALTASAVRKGNELDQDRGRSAMHGLPVMAGNDRLTMAQFGLNGADGNMGMKVEADVNAADMFRLQAMGELVPSDGKMKAQPPQSLIGAAEIYYHPGNHVQGQPFMAPQGHQRHRSHEAVHRHSFPGVGNPTVTGMPYNANQQSRGQPGTFDASLSHDGTSMVRSKTFPCPLFSCGRLFKRQEHLKRHLRTHTMERPYACPKCKKRFSRSDNLNQHLRTHDRGGTITINDNASNDWAAVEDLSDVEELRRTGRLSRSSSISGTESDDLDSDHGMVTMYGGGAEFGMGNEGLGMFGAAATGMGMGSFGMVGYGHPTIPTNSGMGSQFNGSNNSLGLDMNDVDLSGTRVDDDGAILRPDVNGNNQGDAYGQGQDIYYLPTGTSMSFSAGTTSSNSTSDFVDAQWALRPQPSPAFSTISAPSPPPGAIPIIRNHRNSTTGSPATGMRSSHSTSSSVSSYSEDFMTSASAPSHKPSFEHTSLYPPGMNEMAAMAAAAASGGTGPIRRHRSMTPSVVRNGEPVRRPTTASSEYSGGAGNSPGGSNGRGYHPYAAYSSASQSRAGSTHSSPSVYPVPLNGDNMRRSESRSSNYGGLSEQMKSFVNMSLDPSSNDKNAIYGDDHHVLQQQQMFSSDSPGAFPQTESPIRFAHDLPGHYGAAGAAANDAMSFGQAGGVSPGATSYLGGNHHQPHSDHFGGFYQPQQHVTL
ncbi:hypothetical protein AX17_005493 [Amanita inopinata Kibby_2008]|nr:hypothetical protein AX17_005493 [Amanita inopinata Kibby_2008]